MLPICYYRKCGKPSEVNVGKLDVEDGDIEGGHWLTSVYLCKKHAKELAKELGLVLHIEEEEPKGLWAVGEFGELYEVSGLALDRIEKLKEIGNCFATEEEAEKAVEKLKAWKRLKDKGFEFINFPYKKICKYDARTGVGNLEYQVKYYEELESDLDLLFGGENE